jgi:hypothetical protein
MSWLNRVVAFNQYMFVINPCQIFSTFLIFYVNGKKISILPVAIAENKKTICITADEDTQYKRLQPKRYPVELL